MKKFSDILYTLLGIGLLVLTLSGSIDIGIWGILGSIACIGFGLSTMYKMRMASKALKSDILQNPRVIGFYKTTVAAWSAGKLSGLGKAFEKEGEIPYEKFVKKYRPVEGGALFAFFTQFQPNEDEFLVGIGDTDSGSDRGWFVLTNQRLVQKDGRNKMFKEVILAGVNTFDMKGTWTKTMVFKMKSGGTIDFEKVAIYPSEKYISAAINQGKPA